MLRKRFLFLFIVAAVGIGLLWIEDYTQQTIVEENESISLLPDYYGEVLNSRSFNKEGKFERQFMALKSVHYPAQKLTEFNQPVLHTVDQEDGEIWQVTSLNGILYEEKDQLLLREDVQIAPLDRLTDNAITLRTNQLTVFNKLNRAETKLPVTVVSQQGNIDAVGMKIYFNDQRIEFLSKVKARYAP